MTLTAEPGVIGGIPAGGLNFGAAINAQAIIDQPYQFDFYDGGGLDIAFLGLAQADARGQPQRLASSGRGWPAPAASSTSARTPRQVVFVGTFTAGGLRHRDARRAVADPAGRPVAQVRRARSSTAPSAARYAWQRRQPVLYVTERCVFRLAEGGLELIEIAPGIDIERDILAHDGLRAAHPRCRRSRWTRASSPTRRWACARRCSTIPLERRLRPTTPTAMSCSSTSSGSRYARRRTSSTSAATWRSTARPHRPQGLCDRQLRQLRDRARGRGRVRADGQGAGRCVLLDVTRYTTSGFLRLKLGQALAQRGVAPHVYESSDEALKHLREIEDDAAG